jgi:rare lipoprotein A
VHPKYKKELMAASTEYSFGSKVKVTNLANGKEVVVTIKDYGPVKALHPDRVLDLGKEAFKKIASTGAGVIEVRVEAYVDPKDMASVSSSTSSKLISE